MTTQSKPGDLVRQLDRPEWKDQFVAAWPKSRRCDPDRMMGFINRAIVTTPKLAQCDPGTIRAAIFKACRLGLYCDGLLGSGYLVPYKERCEFITGYRGMIDLATRSGDVKQIWAHEVWERDEFDPQQGTDERIIHRPYLGDEDPGKIVCAYAVARFGDGYVQSFIVPASRLNQLRDGSHASSPWRDPVSFPAMCRKTPIRALASYLPLSAEAAEQFSGEDGPREPERREAKVVPIKAKALTEQDLPIPDPGSDADWLQGAGEPPEEGT